MKQLFFFVAFVAVCGLTMAQGPFNACRTCDIIVNIARHHFHNNVTDKAALQDQLHRECRALQFTEGPGAERDCMRIVDANIDQIFADMSTNKPAHQTCVDIKECANKIQRRQKRQGGGEERCRTCEIIVNIARHHFHNNITDKAALMAQLLRECINIGALEGMTAQHHCERIVKANIDQIYADMHTDKSPHQTCVDIRECNTVSTATPPPMPQRRHKRQMVDTCRICEIVINLARHFFNNNVTDRGALERQLRAECQHLGQTSMLEGRECTRMIDQHMTQIFNEINSNRSPRQVCTDIRECRAAEAPLKRQKRQRPADPCRICEIIVNIARHHFNHTVTDEGALKTQLLLECVHLGTIEGAAAGKICTDTVNMHIDQIFADMSTDKSPRQTCRDIGSCAPQPTPSAALPLKVLYRRRK